jgi:hypothetical protein
LPRIEFTELNGYLAAAERVGGCVELRYKLFPFIADRRA